MLIFYKILEDYICNYLLYAYGNICIKEKLEAWRIITRLIKELEEKIEFFKFIDIIIECIKFYASDSKLDNNNKQLELENIYLGFIKLFGSISKIYYYLGEADYLHHFVTQYVEKIEKYAFNVNNSILAKTYYCLGNLYVELDKLSFAIIVYTEALYLLSNIDKETELMISINFNLGLIFFVTDQFNNAKVKLESALKLQEETKGEYISEQTAMIYETLGEIHLEYKHYLEALKYLNKSMELKHKIWNIGVRDKKNFEQSFIKTNIMIDFINQILCKTEEVNNIKMRNIVGNNGNNQDNNQKSLLNSNFQDLYDMINGPSGGNRPIKNKKLGQINKNFGIINEEEKDELEKFFLFITKLSNRQIELLNNGQHMNLHIPIMFSPEFKNELTNHQKLELSDFNLILLTRNNILKNPEGLIEENNLNYNILYPSDQSNNITSIKNFFVTNKLIKNWESTGNASMPLLSNNKQLFLTAEIPFKGKPIFKPKLTLDNVINEENKKDIKKDLNTPSDKSGQESSLSFNLNNIYNQTNNINLKPKEKRIDFNFESFKQIITEYIRNNKANNDNLLNYITDIQLFKLSKALTKEELEFLMSEPQVFYNFLDNQDILSSNESEVEEDNDLIERSNNDIIEEESEKSYNSIKSISEIKKRNIEIDTMNQLKI